MLIIFEFEHDFFKFLCEESMCSAHQNATSAVWYFNLNFRQLFYIKVFKNNKILCFVQKRCSWTSTKNRSCSIIVERTICKSRAAPPVTCGSPISSSPSKRRKGPWRRPSGRLRSRAFAWRNSRARKISTFCNLMRTSEKIIVLIWSFELFWFSTFW